MKIFAIIFDALCHFILCLRLSLRSSAVSVLKKFKIFFNKNVFSAVCVVNALPLINYDPCFYFVRNEYF